MRNVLCRSLVSHASKPEFAFLTGDLGFQALEPLRGAMGARFINAGVAEQNMISVAAGLARTGLRPWVYSIAPFVYARPFEQIRNDVCLHNLPVVLVGNGGGYAYGVMGATHHALEDYGSLLCLANMIAYIPAFASDVEVTIDRLMKTDHPAYLRLGRCELPKSETTPAYSAWRRLISGPGPTILAVGPLAGGLWQELLAREPINQPSLWVLTELPIRFDSIPHRFLVEVKRTGNLMVVEEHVAQGSAGQMLAHTLSIAGEMPPKFTHCCALGYSSGKYGSQAFHRRECGLDAKTVVNDLVGQ